MFKLIKFILAKLQKPCPEVETLRAIENVRKEFTLVAKSGDAVAARECHARLMALYASLNVHNVLIAIERIDFKDAA